MDRPGQRSSTPPPRGFPSNQIPEVALAKLGGQEFFCVKGKSLRPLDLRLPVWELAIGVTSRNTLPGDKLLLDDKPDAGACTRTHTHAAGRLFEVHVLCCLNMSRPSRQWCLENNISMYCVPCFHGQQTHVSRDRALEPEVGHKAMTSDKRLKSGSYDRKKLLHNTDIKANNMHSLMAD